MNSVNSSKQFNRNKTLNIVADSPLVHRIIVEKTIVKLQLE
jgi:hypothetical protein